MVEEALTGCEILVVLGRDEQKYVETLHAALGKENVIKEFRSVGGLMAALRAGADRARTLIVTTQAAAVEMAAMDVNPAADIPMLVIAPRDHNVDEYTEAMRSHHARFEYLNKVECPDPARLVRTLALIAKDGPVGLAL